MSPRTMILLLLALIGAMLFSSCATPEQSAAVATAGAGALVTFIQSLADSGVLPPEKVAELTTTAHNVQSVVQATQVAIGSIGEAVAAVKETADAAWTTEEVVGAGAVTSGVTGTGVMLLRNKSRQAALEKVGNGNGAAT